MLQSLETVQVGSRKAQFCGRYYSLFSTLIYQNAAQILTFSYLQMIQRQQRKALMNFKVIFFDYIIEHFKIKWFLMLIKKAHIVRF